MLTCQETNMIRTRTKDQAVIPVETWIIDSFHLSCFFSFFPSL
jgi:hypothetical protein